MANAANAMLCSHLVQQIRPRSVASLATLIGPTTTKLEFRFKPNKQKILSFNRLNLAMAASQSPSQDPLPSTPGRRVEDLYLCINEKKIKEVDKIVAEDCCIQDFSFPKPFKGKKEVLKFFEELIINMGKNVKFKIDKLEENAFTSWVHWHLEWKDQLIPFTRGCSTFEFSKDGHSLRTAKVFIESPVKQGGLALALLKIVTTFFDEYPQAAEWFLKSQHIVGKWAYQIYAILVAPITKPIIESYINFLKLMAWVLAYVIKIVIFLKKIFVQLNR